MRAAIVPIGNSKGIRIPKVILEQCHIKRNVDLETKGLSIIIRPFKEKSRQGWAEAFKEMHDNKEDRLIIADRIDIDTGGHWRW